MLEKLKSLTEEQLKEITSLRSAADIEAFAKSHGINLTADDISQLLQKITDGLFHGEAPQGMLGNIAGGLASALGDSLKK